jgi:putative membrane protein
MSKYLLSSLVAAILAAAPAVLAQVPGQRDTRDTKDKSDQSQTQDRSTTGASDRVRSGEQAAGTSDLRNNERQFLMEAAQENLKEVELGTLAQERGSSPEVKEFGERMVEEHKKSLEKLKTTASEVNVTIPDELQAKNKSTVDRFAKMSGDEFDKAYMQHMVQDHKKAVNKFEKTSKNARNEAVKSYASETLPVLREHLEEAQKIHGQVAAKGTASREKDATQTPSPRRSDDEHPAGTQRDPETKRDPTGTPRNPNPTGTPRNP